MCLQVTKIIYIGLASLSFTKILEAYFTKCLNGPKEDDILEGVNFRPAKILLTIWHNGNKYFLVSMAILVHLFSVSIYKDYTKMCAFVPFLTFRSVSAILLSLVSLLTDTRKAPEQYRVMRIIKRSYNMHTC